MLTDFLARADWYSLDTHSQALQLTYLPDLFQSAHVSATRPPLLNSIY